jgi:5S rRNA maturation endonuclease (ribonuclease M5)
MTDRVGLIVEGRRDREKIEGMLKKDIPIVVLEGDNLSRFNEKLIERHINNNVMLFIMTDPDEAGDNAARKIQDKFELDRIELDRNSCVKYSANARKKEYGLEHASEFSIMMALEKKSLDLSKKMKEMMKGKDLNALLDNEFVRELEMVGVRSVLINWLIDICFRNDIKEEDWWEA